MDNTYFSVVIPAYNRADFIEKAIHSVINQSFQRWEVIVIDDASTDTTPKILNKYTANAKIRIHRNEVNLERSASRNKGVEIASGKYICFLDSDDYFLENHLQNLYELIQSKGETVAFFHSSLFQKIDDTRKFLPVSINPKNPVESVIQHNVPIITACIHKDILVRERFKVSMNINEDIYLFARIVAQYPFFGHETPTVVWVLHEGNTSKQVRDYITPQIEAGRIMFSDPVLGPFLSDEFISTRYHELYSSLIYLNINSLPKSLSFLMKAWRYKPSFQSNKVAIGNILYHLPFGGLLRKIKGVFN